MTDNSQDTPGNPANQPDSGISVPPPAPQDKALEPQAPAAGLPTQGAPTPPPRQPAPPPGPTAQQAGQTPPGSEAPPDQAAAAPQADQGQHCDSCPAHETCQPGQGAPADAVATPAQTALSEPDASAAPAGQFEEGEHPPDKDEPLLCVRYGRMAMLGLFRCTLGDVLPQTRVIVKTDRGLEMGWALKKGARGMTYQGHPIHRVGVVRRIATKDDLMQERHLRDSENRARKYCEERITTHKLPMQIAGVEHLFGGDRIVFYFISEGRVDFRDLVKDLAHEYQTRIEMRQIGVRDEARLQADYERCGQFVCCRTFIKEFMPISMRMAKLQKATLDPSKISGRCGRLMCCLRYEYETYEELRKSLPKKNSYVMTPDGPGRVIGGDILTQLVKVAIGDKTTFVPVEALTARDLREEEVLEWQQRHSGPPRRPPRSSEPPRRDRFLRDQQPPQREPGEPELGEEPPPRAAEPRATPEADMPAAPQEVEQPADLIEDEVEEPGAPQPGNEALPAGAPPQPGRRGPDDRGERRGRRRRRRRRRGGGGGPQQGGPHPGGGGPGGPPQGGPNQGGGDSRGGGPGGPQQGGLNQGGGGNRDGGPSGQQGDGGYRRGGGPGNRDRPLDNRRRDGGNRSQGGPQGGQRFQGNAQASRSQGGEDLGLPKRVLESFGIDDHEKNRRRDNDRPPDNSRPPPAQGDPEPPQSSS